MAFIRSLFASKTAQTPTAPTFTGLKIQTATPSVPVPILWGRGKLAPNIIWYNGFTSVPIVTSTPSSGGKGAGSTQNSANVNWVYYVAIIMALCEGPISTVLTIWRGKAQMSVADASLSLAIGSNPQSTWSYLTTSYPSQAFAYQQTAYLYAASYPLGASANLDNLNAEIDGLRAGTGTNGVDADPALVIEDFLTSTQYGVGFSTSDLDLTTLLGGGGDASLQTYCKGIGICISPILNNQESASSILARWLAICNTAPVWSQGKLKFLPYGDTATTAGTHIPITLTDAVPQTADISGDYAITVTAAARFVSDSGVIYAATGAALTHTGLAPTGVGTYGISPNGKYLFDSTDAGTDVTISYVYSVAATYTPNLTPVYNLADEDFLSEGNDDPLKVTRADPYKSWNVLPLEMSDRNNAYNLVPVEARDQAAMELFGRRTQSTFTAHEICDPTVASVVSQIMLQRLAYMRKTYKFRLSVEYCLLEPMDIVTVTDSLLGLSSASVRILEIEENDDGNFDLTAEEFPAGLASATLYPTQQVNASAVNTSATASAINQPFIFEPPASMLAQGQTSQIWMGVSSQDPFWGGANIWIRPVGGDYIFIGTVYGNATMGLTTASLAKSTTSNPDIINTLSVDLTESLGSLATGSSASADVGQYLGGIQSSPGKTEVISYGTATLTSAYNYDLTYLMRGLYDTPPNGAWVVGSTFCLFDAGVFKYNLDPSMVNATLNIKFQSFNVFGNGLQDLSTCTEYTYNPNGGLLVNPFFSPSKIKNPWHPQRRTTNPVASALLNRLKQDMGEGSLTSILQTIEDLGIASGEYISNIIELDLGAASTSGGNTIWNS